VCSVEASNQPIGWRKIELKAVVRTRITSISVMYEKDIWRATAPADTPAPIARKTNAHCCASERILFTSRL